MLATEREDGCAPPRDELWILAHTRKDGTVLDSESAKTVVSL